MRLATLDAGTRDGRLVLVDRSGTRYTPADEVAGTLQAALDDWSRSAPRLAALARRLDEGAVPASLLEPTRLLAPLPRAYEWIDASAFVHHVRLVRRARGAEPPPSLETDPLVYQGGSGALLGPSSPMPLPDPSWGLDFEAEVCVILGDVKRGTRAEDASQAIALVMLGNDWSYRNLIPPELAKGFGFFNSKPATAFSPFAVTLDELGAAWQGGRLHLRMSCELNGARVGNLDASVGMQFSFHQLIAHIAMTRDLTAGTILGSGTVSNAEEGAGVACLAEQRCLEIIATGAPSTRLLDVGDRVRIEMRDAEGRNLFGTIDQEVISG
jgi:fumarylacetoacetate (FAA) hydrolase